MDHMQRLIDRYPALKSCERDIRDAFELLAETYRKEGKLLVCGNGGSAADADHIVGELMKGFVKKRPIPAEFRQQLDRRVGTQAAGYLGERLQGALPAISLNGHNALTSAFSNDVAGDLSFAQQVYGYGRQGDTLMGISTSGSSMNVRYAVQTAKAMGLRTIGLTGSEGYRLQELCDVAIMVPANSTMDIQEFHLPIYHTLCLMLEETFFS